MISKTFLLLPLLLCLEGCAHNYFFKPEVEGPGATSDKGAVRYSIPPVNPAVEVRLVSFGVVNTPEDAHSQAQSMIQVRAFITEISPRAQLTDFALFDPKVQSISIGASTPDAQTVGTEFARSKTAKNDASAPSGSKTRAYDLFFPMPPRARSANSLQSFVFHWSVRYGERPAVQQTTRFDRLDSSQQQSQNFYFNDPTSSAVLPPGYDGSWGYWMP